jgi:hypothetical protein
VAARASVLALLAFLVATASCGPACPEGEVECDGVCVPAMEPTLESVQETLFGPTCAEAGCHDRASASAGLDLGDPIHAHLFLIDVPATQAPNRRRVAPGDAAASYLMSKLRGEGMAGDPSERMPRGAGLCEARIEEVADWIDAGAPSTVPVDQCVNDGDAAVFDGLGTKDQSGGEVVSDIAGGCPLGACTAEVIEILFDNTEELRDALGRCIGECVQEATGLSEGCAGCYGWIGACAAGYCADLCASAQDSPECRDCVDLNCVGAFGLCVGEIQ